MLSCRCFIHFHGTFPLPCTRSTQASCSKPHDFQASCSKTHDSQASCFKPHAAAKQSLGLKSCKPTPRPHAAKRHPRSSCSSKTTHMHVAAKRRSGMLPQNNAQAAYHTIAPRHAATKYRSRMLPQNNAQACCRITIPHVVLSTTFLYRVTTQHT